MGHRETSSVKYEVCMFVLLGIFLEKICREGQIEIFKHRGTRTYYGVKFINFLSLRGGTISGGAKFPICHPPGKFLDYTILSIYNSACYAHTFQPTYTTIVE